MSEIDHEHRAGQLWDVLVEVAESRGAIITYGDAAARIGIHHRAMRFPLELIARHCYAEGLPPLGGLVINKSEGVPGPGFWAWSDLERLREIDWSTIPNPYSELEEENVSEISKAILTTPAAADTYVQKLSRGNEQRVFNRIVMIAYDRKCAICDTGFEEVLEAAHIIRFGDERRHLRVHPTNGICLCANHHRMIDSGRLCITPEYELVFDDPNENDGGYNDADRAISSGIHGKKLRVPTREDWRPSPELLAEKFGL